MPDASSVSIGSWATSMPALIGLASGVVTSLIGLASGFGIERFRDNRAYKREREARDSARRDAQIERRNEFQLATLLRLQEEVAALHYSILELHLGRRVTSQKSGRWPDIINSPDLNDRAIAASIQVQTLSVRVHDGNTRALVEKYRASIVNLELAQTRDEADTFDMECSMAFAALNDRIGKLLEELDRIEIGAD